MAERRMFTKKIIDSDAFLDMPLSAQSLYFHLNMRADDDGFVNNPRKIQRMIGSSEDDLKLLLVKRFILGFDSGIVVIKHWRMHNLLRKDRYNPTQYQEELLTLGIKDNGAYTENKLLATNWQPIGNQLATQDSIGKESIEKNNNSSADAKQDMSDSVRRIIEHLNKRANKRYRWNTASTRKLVESRLQDFSEEDCITVIDNMCDRWLGDENMEQYLRPITLFCASKFEGYLNSAPVAKRERRIKRNENIEALENEIVTLEGKIDTLRTAYELNEDRDARFNIRGKIKDLEVIVESNRKKLERAKMCDD